MSSECLNNTFRVTNFNIGLSDHFSRMAQEIEFGNRSKADYIWLIPANLFATALGLFWAPMLAAVNFIAGCAFAIIGCFASSTEDRLWYKGVAVAFFGAAAGQLTDVPLTMIARVFYPAIQSQAVVTRGVMQCTSRILCVESDAAAQGRMLAMQTVDYIRHWLVNALAAH